MKFRLDTIHEITSSAENRSLAVDSISESVEFEPLTQDPKRNPTPRALNLAPTSTAQMAHLLGLRAATAAGAHFSTYRGGGWFRVSCLVERHLLTMNGVLSLGFVFRV